MFVHFRVLKCKRAVLHILKKSHGRPCCHLFHNLRVPGFPHRKLWIDGLSLKWQQLSVLPSFYHTHNGTLSLIYKVTFEFRWSVVSELILKEDGAVTSDFRNQQSETECDWSRTTSHCTLLEFKNLKYIT